MENQAITNSVSAQAKQIIQQLINSWATQNKIVSNFFTKYEDAFYLNEVAPNRNRAIYLLGHLIAVNDGLFPLFGLGDKLFPQLETVFISNPDKTISDIPSIVELKHYWETLNETLAEKFSKMEPEEWLEKHTKVSDEDFAKDPLRNKLNVLIGRTNHQSYHVGQLALLTPRA